MREPGVGAYGIAVVATTLIARVAGFASLGPDIALLAALWCASRTAIACAPARLPYVREEGLATALVSSPSTGWVALGFPVAGALAWVGVGVSGLAAVGALVIVSAGVLALARARIGGYTGDVLGAAIVTAETVGLLVAGARW
jgi:adenosylcobinamide-GDP ribazoletransferase